MSIPVLACALAAAFLAACSKAPSDAVSTDAGAQRGARLRIAVVPKGTTHEFWKSVHAGAVKASRELDVDVVWKGPLREDDLKGQIDVVSSFVAQGVSGIVLAPLNDAALKAPVHAAAQAKIPVVAFDSDLAGEEHVSFVATDNQAAGRLAGEHLAKAIGGKGHVVVLRYQEGSASTQNREKGFLDAVRAMPGITVASDNQYGGATTETAFNKSESLLLAQRAAEGTIAGVFTPNESTTFGMLQALRKTNVARKVKFVGFDASDKLLGALRDGDIEALVVQDPFTMGYQAVKTMAAHLRGERVERRIDTGARVVTRQDLDDPAVMEVVKPDLARWLGE
ncbi:sugar ABC transporter substrate-binding protein [Sorangium cellulosum]|uniref:Sugar ABC transporter substrate-binding protein n=1 Tax=Sorangium cellulosum TaxID=56 RepID=A0A150SC88_SORCE|nr:sugar ABC transporter substrate-binding protein [Sorangium cellulosum]